MHKWLRHPDCGGSCGSGARLLTRFLVRATCYHIKKKKINIHIYILVWVALQSSRYWSDPWLCSNPPTLPINLPVLVASSNRFLMRFLYSILVLIGNEERIARRVCFQVVFWRVERARFLREFQGALGCFRLIQSGGFSATFSCLKRVGALCGLDFIRPKNIS